jgi:hypothetical protein
MEQLESQFIEDIKALKLLATFKIYNPTKKKY